MGVGLFRWFLTSTPVKCSVFSFTDYQQKLLSAVKANSSFHCRAEFVSLSSKIGIVKNGCITKMQRFYSAKIEKKQGIKKNEYSAQIIWFKPSLSAYCCFKCSFSSNE